MTKYILHGGKTADGLYTKDFFDEIVRDLPKKDITLVYAPFAKEENIWTVSFEKFKQEFISSLPDKNITFLLGDKDPEKFLDQTHIVDIIFLPGGNNDSLLTFLKQIPFPMLTEHFLNKTIVGVSAGANVLAKYFYSNDTEEISEGLGLLPIKAFCHYTLEKEPQLEELESYKEQLTSFALPENYFVILQ